MRLVRAAITLGILAGAMPARAERWDRVADRIQGGGWLHYELAGLHAIDDDPARARGAPPSDGGILGGVRIGGFVGAGAAIGYHVGLDLLAGSTLDRAGFAYDVAAYPIGIAVRLGPTGALAIAAGIGASGAVGTLDDGAQVPVQTTLELGEAIRVLARARVSYILGAAGRQSGAPSLAFADEVDAMLGLRVGNAYRRHGFPAGNGYFLAVGYREQQGTRFAGVTIGYSLDAALPRRFVDEDRRHR